MKKVKLDRNGSFKINDDKMVASCHVFTNGNAIVFNKDGTQMPKLQGHVLKSASKIIKNSCTLTEFSLTKFSDGSTIPITMKEFGSMFVSPHKGKYNKCLSL